MEWREILYIREWWSVVLETKRGGRRQDLICLEKGRKQKKKKKKKKRKKKSKKFNNKKGNNPALNPLESGLEKSNLTRK